MRERETSTCVYVKNEELNEHEQKIIIIKKTIK